ncbi:Fanconi anemia group J protein homolog [Microplitis demolitor]|uniref:Fanconi anemia group J protein homolog n=1 Tax=Microplitis demolitor TaxID=69319 RepID=UPI0004CD7136|nr:Fanconi anemia group J protein homolog [Microplitis demolitor]XP_008555684.1 Fanconi anemia group J protein homolog [Microplitis demolitor]
MISDDDSSDEFQPSKIIISKKSNYFPAINKNPGILVAGKNNQDIEAIIISDDDCMNSTDSSVSPNLTINYNIDKDVDNKTIAPANPINTSNAPALQGTSSGLFRWGSKRIQSSLHKFLKKRNISPLERESKKQNTNYDDDDVMTEDEDDDRVKTKLFKPLVSKPNKVMIAGVNVMFPLKPYSSQIAVMNALIRGCAKEEHALLESPTGSGKTLALLCGALAWQEHYAAQYSIQFQEWINQQCNAEFNDVEMDFEEILEKKVVNNKDKVKAPVEEPKKIPKIYYGSRTHRQISQVIKELRRTAYADTKMTILSSRDFTCIQQSNKNKTELCNELLDPIKKQGCPFYNESNKRTISTYKNLDKVSLPQPWDIEELVEVGKEYGCCPYFAARNLMIEANIIFCPYNYLIDPNIRKSMQISLKDEIVILDEAHNIEDICRDSASETFRVDELMELIKECEHLTLNVAKDKIPPYAAVIKSYCEAFNQFIELTNLESKEAKNDQLTSKFWTSRELLELMSVNNLDVRVHYQFKSASLNAIDKHNEAKEKSREPSNLHGDPKKQVVVPTVSPIAVRTLERLNFAIDMLTSEQYSSDFRALIREVPERFCQKITTRSPSASQKPRNQRIRMLDLLCMNPAVVFSSLAKSARSIILASGTLSPTTSFSSELDTKFPHMLHANHVIPKEQVLVKAVGQGPNNVNLRATYANVNSWKFQDELGQVLVDVCETVPFGILCFFSSYTSMKTLTNRWWQNGTMTKINQCKRIIEEPRVSKDLSEVMNEFRTVIKECTEGTIDDRRITGALLFAVFRGKVAEGIDFSDNEARCVLTIGIPFAVRNDPAVELKVAYNDLHSKEKKLLRGSEWYAVQAYRALNQALGRCIRHRNDWGAILLVDDRFLISHNQSYLPNWVKSMWSNRNNNYNLRHELKQFVNERIKCDEERKLNSD